ncbi:MAG: hypothetical protein HC840_08800 [Leptolyngbyaceae cyanobacterium RM2_2_4]|nr:hypothetical protein [Leptolyngbyaceae cyanobacterium SM1_4_3]NJN92183.1 hypothetical protein [Leptolyngbyaceae cyanobacterium SL_5_14]NJO49519.1 hypothetical protein [Leptolyngbyaceae cyanobacterium RM2_2_4]
MNSCRGERPFAPTGGTGTGKYPYIQHRLFCLNLYEQQLYSQQGSPHAQATIEN